MSNEITQKIRALRRRIGENIHDARRRRRMPLEKLARLSGMGADVIDRLEIGKGEIDLMHIVRLSAALEVDVGALLDTQITNTAAKEQ